MTPENHLLDRVQFLLRIVGKECRYLLDTYKRLLETPFTLERAAQLEAEPVLAERLEAF